MPQHSTQAGEAPYQVRLRPVSVVQGQVIRLSDIAEIDGPDEMLCGAIGRLDLDDAPRSDQTVVISKSQVEMRLKVAKAPAGKIAVTGKQTVVGANAERQVRQVAASKSDLDQDEVFTPRRREIAARSSAKKSSIAREHIIELTKSAILSRLPWSADDVEIEVTHIGPAAESLSRDELAALSVEIKVSGPPLGRVQLAVRGTDWDEEQHSIPVIAVVKRYQEMVVMKQAIDLGQVIRPEDVYVERREVRELGIAPVTLSDVVGQMAGRPLAELHPVRRSDLRANPVGGSSTVPVPKSAAVPVIRRGDLVKVTAHGGPLAITVTAKAQQDGAVGDVIRLENQDSKKVVTGRVVSRGEAEADL